MKKVTDPNLLSQLENENDQQPVNDPNLLAQLEGEDESNDLMDKISGSLLNQMSPENLGKNLAIGPIKVGEKIGEKLTGEKPAQDWEKYFNLPESQTSPLVQGLGGYIPFGMAGGAGLMGEMLAGGAHGAATAKKGEEVEGGLQGASFNALLRAIGSGLNAARPSQMFRGNLSPQELQRNLDVAGNTNTGLGDVIESPTLKKQYENVLTKIPFSGANQRLQQTGKQVVQEGQNILNDFLGDANPRTIPDQIHETLNNQYDLHQTQKQELYKIPDKIADKINLKLELPTFARNATIYKNALEDTQMLKHEPEVKSLINKLQNYEHPTTDVESLILDKEGKPLISETKYPTLSEANVLASKLNNLGERFTKSPDPTQRSAGSTFYKLGQSLKSDIKNSIHKSGNKELQDSFAKAEKNYAENFSPFLDKDAYKYIGDPNANVDNIVNDFLKTSSKADYGKQLSKLTRLLPAKQQRLLGYSYFSRALDNEGNLNPNKLATLIKKLGPNQFEALIPDSLQRKRLLNYSRLARMNKEAQELMFNPHTGQRSSEHIPAILASIGGSMGALMAGLPGAAVGPLAGIVGPGLASKPLVHALTSPSFRRSLVKAMIENKKMFQDPSILQALGQAGLNKD